MSEIAVETKRASVPRLLTARVHWADLKPDEFRYIPCPICSTFDYKPLGSVVINWAEFTVVQCSSCSLIWRTPLPDPQHLNDLYSPHYYNVRDHAPELVHQVGIPDSQPADQEKRRQKSKEEIQNWAGRGIFPKDKFGTPKRFLEVGGGRGYLQLAAKETGFETVGLEISPHGIREAINRGLVVLPVPLEGLVGKYIPYPNFFDVAAFFDFLEHTTDPARIIRMVEHLMKDDGIMIFRMPMADSCPTLHLIDHIWHFSDETMHTLFEREGLEIFDQHDSGRFMLPDRSDPRYIQNRTFFARKRRRA